MTVQLYDIDPAETMIDELWRMVDDGKETIHLDMLASMILDRLIDLHTNEIMQLPAALQEIYDVTRSAGDPRIASLKLDVVIARIEQGM